MEWAVEVEADTIAYTTSILFSEKENKRVVCVRGIVVGARSGLYTITALRLTKDDHVGW